MVSHARDVDTSDSVHLERRWTHTRKRAHTSGYRALEEKRRIVEETLAEGTSVALVARTHGVNANLLFTWRKLYQAGRLGSGGAKLLP
jgi:transposase